MPHELYKRYRPKNLKQIVGQPEAVKVLSRFVKDETVPHALLFVGPSGCGKSTLTRFMRVAVNCHKHDYQEHNCTNFRGMDSVRDIVQRMTLRGLHGPNRVCALDEMHQLTNPAQSLLLKPLEDTPAHFYFFGATTDPGKIISTVQNRCTIIKLRSLTPKEITTVVGSVCKKESIELFDSVAERIVECADGSARRALVLLDAVYKLDTEEEQLEAIQSSDAKRLAVEVARILIRPTGATWAELSKVLLSIDDDPETVRRLVLGYCTSILLGGGKLAKRAHVVIENFRDNFYDGGKAALASTCYGLLGGK